MKKAVKQKALPNAVAETPETSVHLGYSGTKLENDKLLRRARQEAAISGNTISRTTLMRAFIKHCLAEPVGSIKIGAGALRGRAAANKRKTNAVSSKVITGANGARTATARRTRKATAAGTPNTMAAAVGGTTQGREVA